MDTDAHCFFCVDLFLSLIKISSLILLHRLALIYKDIRTDLREEADQIINLLNCNDFTPKLSTYPTRSLVACK